jgi:hypothetical protein
MLQILELSWNIGNFLEDMMKLLKYKPFRSNDETSKNPLTPKKKFKL